MPTAMFLSRLALPEAGIAPAAPPMQTVLCPGDQPIALLPVRLETRFFTENDVTELRVRIYPDKIHIDSHETDLTPNEKQWGEHAWQQEWRAGSDAKARAAAWRQLAERFEPVRAAWIVRALRPTNPADRPTAPVPPDKPLPKPLKFPAVKVVTDGQDAAWRTAPQARLLPDRWIAVLHSGGAPVAVVTGSDVRRPLAVGPNPRAAAAKVPGDQAAVDPGMLWMVDFAAAEAAGMALRIPIEAQWLSAGIDSLYVMGVAASVSPAQSALQVARLFDGHQYTDGLAFLRQGVPSNNTAEQRSGYITEDPAFAPSPMTPNVAVPGADTNARRLGNALGLSAEQTASTLGQATGGRWMHERDMRSMNAVLWQSTWGYFLSNMIGMKGTGLTAPILAWARQHFVNQVRAGGPLAPLRCGRQPYGVLPVTSLDLWQPGPPANASDTDPAREAWLRDMVKKLRDNIWRVRLTEVARIGRRQAPPDPEADLADVMRTDAISYTYVGRSMMGRHYLQHLRAFLGEDLQNGGFIGIHDAVAIGIVQRLGFPWRPRLAKAIYEDRSWRMTSPLVQAGEVSPTRPLEPDFIGMLLALPRIADLIAAQPTDSTSLLAALLRHSMLLETAHAAAAIEASQPGIDLANLLEDPELIDLITGAPPTPTFKRRLALKVPAVTGNRTIGQHLEQLTTFDTPMVAALGAFRQGLAHLQTLDSQALQMLMLGTLDLAAHRLDAWMTSLASRRLGALRETTAQGVRVGGYGWVENLRPGPAPTPITPPPGEQAPISELPNDSGFIHAPSMTHAATAALLRNAHLGASGVPDANGPFAVDLSSRRLREAQALLDGMRQGQPLAALLGYRFERRLHDMGQDAFIAPARTLAPLVAGKLESSNAPLESIAANNVVDGLKLYQRWRDEQATVLARLQAVPGASAAVLEAIGKELDALGDSIDAVSDALTAETAYQMVRGNTSRTASTLAAMATGDAPAPELEVARTPRTGVPITHRVVQLFSGAPAATPGWAPAAKSPRAAAEPMLNAWAAKLLGDARTVRCTVEAVNDSGAVIRTVALPLSELVIAPLDAVFAVDAQTRAGETTELEQRVLYQARRRAGGFNTTARLRLQHVRPADLPAGHRTLLDVLEQARAARRLLGSVRAVEPSDLAPPERGATGSIDLEELKARVASAEKAYRAAHTALDTLVKKGAAATAEALRAMLMRMAGFGVSGAVPTVPALAKGDEADVRAGLLLQARAMRKESRVRIERLTALAAVAAATEERARRDQFFGRLQAAFGDGFVALPQFTCAHAAELAKALAGSTKVQGGDALAVHTWLARCAPVRDPTARFATALRGAEVLNTGERLALRVAQLPQADTDRWVGLPALAGKTVMAGKLSLVVQAAQTFDPARPVSGLLVDEWVEVVPSRTETTAITFQYNPPDTCAPQSVLLAVPPVIGQPWTAQTLHRVLVETLDMAKLRAVDTEALGELGHYLPALFYAFNAKDDVPSTDFQALLQ